MGDNVSNIHTAMIAIRQDCPALKREGEMKGFGANYVYLTIEQTIDALRPLMDREGVLMYPGNVSVISERTEDRGQDNGGNPRPLQKYVRILVTYHMIHAKSGTGLQVQVPGEAMDTGDKVMNKAMTAAEKVCLRQAFLLMTDDDPDHHPSPQDADPAKKKAADKAPPVFKPGEGETQETLDKAVVALEAATDEARVRTLMSAAMKRKWTQIQWDLLKVLANKKLDSFTNP